MNYFGHAAVACRVTAEPRFVLGAMLPDLVPMAGVSVPKTFTDAELSRGIAFHLETDALFHDTAAFVSWNRHALRELRELGVSRGPARACAHMGVEMLIDAGLVPRDDTFEGYEQALRCVVASPTVLAPLPHADQQRCQVLCHHLLERGRAVFEPSAKRFALRLGRTLAGRSRLRPSESELLVIADYLSDFETPLIEVSSLMVELEPLWQKTDPTSAHPPRPAS